MAEKHALIPNPLAMYTQPETKDMSKNLMSGDFEKQYSEKVGKTCRWKQACVVAGGVTVTALVVCLLALVLVRDVQLTRLRSEVDELTATVITMSANLKSLNQKFSNNKQLLNEFISSEDTIYADEDQDITNLADDKKDNSLEKLHGLTVLEDDGLGDDEDPQEADDDGDESGDWYPDFDVREKMASTNRVHLKADEDFTDSVVTFERAGNKQALLSNIREIKRRLNENPEDPDLPGLVPTEATKESQERVKRSVFADAADVDSFAAPRILLKAEGRKTKKYSGNLEAPEKLTLHTVTRTPRNSDDEVQRRPFIAAHFHGNTSHLNVETHEHYKGNGLVRVSHDAAHDVWYPAAWTTASPHPRPTLTRNGHIRVHHTGVYLVYVQIYYLDSHDVISWVLHRTNPEIEGRETVLQCAQSSHSAERIDKPNSCFSASALFLKEGDKLAVRNTGGDRHSLMQPEKSFIGLVKLADAEDPTEEF